MGSDTRFVGTVYRTVSGTRATSSRRRFRATNTGIGHGPPHNNPPTGSSVFGGRRREKCPRRFDAARTTALKYVNRLRRPTYKTCRIRSISPGT